MGNLQRLRFAIDTGGTFTDIVVLDEDTGEFIVEKAPTTPSNTLIGVLDSIKKAKLDLARVERFFIHGATTGMNCLLERKGARTGYVTTKGFRDVPEIGKHDRPQLYNIKYKKPPPIVPRELTFEVTQRGDYTGRVLVDLNIEEVRQVARLLKKKRVESVAVNYLHAYKNPDHERKTREIILEEYPEVSVSISSDVAMEHREYERSMTVILDAYLKKEIQSWIGNLENELVQSGFKGRVIITRSDGGGMTSELAMSNPIHTLLSGPAGGVIGGIYFANDLNYRNIVTIDMGGTSTDVCLIRNGLAMMKDEARIGDFRLLMSNMSIKTIGAGGGSIGWIDVAGALHVGPQSAGANPGPICYKQGGTEPTITDAAMSSGYLDPGYFLGGEMPLDLDSAKKGIGDNIGKPLNMNLELASSGILRIALSNMAEAIRVITIGQGEDPRDYHLLCYGGGGGLFGAYLIGELEMPSAIVPIAAANFSALGMLMVDIRHDFSQTFIQPLNTINFDELNGKARELLQKGEVTLQSEGIAPGDREIHVSLDMRYTAQEHTVNVPINFAMDEKAKDKIYEEFTKVYKQVWRYSLPQPAAIVHLRVTAIGKVPKPKLREIKAGNTKPDEAQKGKREVFDFIDRKWANFNIYERSKLLANNTINGPAIIEESTTTTTVPNGYQCAVDMLGNLVIRRRR